MQCLRCGKNIPEDAVFCIDCQAEMNKCPVAPGTPVAIPPRPKQNKPRPRTASKDEQISRLRTILFLSLREEEKLPTGRNFKTTASTGESTSSGK